jgi:hypothetical protein
MAENPFQPFLGQQLRLTVFTPPSQDFSSLSHGQLSLTASSHPFMVCCRKSRPAVVEDVSDAAGEERREKEEKEEKSELGVNC